MPGDDVYLETILNEFKTARQASAEGNTGKTRVCARRAAGAAIAWYLSTRPGVDWGKDAVTQIRHLTEEPSVPQEIRDAAGRLAARVSEDFKYASGFDPIVDARLITDYLIKVINATPPR